MPNHSCYTSYLLRVWRSEGATGCRASLENVATGERVGFASLAALMDFLEAHAPGEAVLAAPGTRPPQVGA